MVRIVNESAFFELITKDKDDPKFCPRFKSEVAEKFAVPFSTRKDKFVPKDAGCLDEEYSAHLMDVQAKLKVYQDNFNAEVGKFVSGQDSAIYLVYQPIWNCSTWTLSGLEVLCRVENGKDDAPMPALANFQADPAQQHLREDFTRIQLEFAVLACKQLPNTWVSVNVRPDQLAPLKEDLIVKALETSVQEHTSNLVIEVTEYAPIDAEVLALIGNMKEAGVVFALDDVNEVRDQPVPAGMAGRSHSCSFDVAKSNATLFAQQKLATQLSCSVFRKEVFPTPEYAGGKAVPFLRSMILPEEDNEGIQERKKLVECWVHDVSVKNPSTQFVIECSVYPQDLQVGRADLYPAIGLFEAGIFHIQGGRTGGRGFQLDAFLMAQVDTKLKE